MKNILILIERIYRDNGGASTTLDLSETIFNLGYDAKVALAIGNVIKYKFYPASLYKQIVKFDVPAKNLYSMPSSYPIGKEKNNQSKRLNIRSIVSTVSEFVDNREKTFKKALSEADLIIDACMMPHSTFNLIRKGSCAPIIYNHNGSPEAVGNYWIEPYHLPESDFKKDDKYARFCKRYDGILFQAEDQAKACAETGAMPAERCFVVPPSSQENEVISAPLASSPYSKGRRSVVCVGSVQPRKAQDLAIAAFNEIADQFKDTDLHFVGGGSGLEGEFGNKLHALVKENGLESRVYFHGHRKDYLRFMAHATVLVQSSKAEGVSRILREAMLIQLPIVSFGIKGTSATLKDGAEALLAEPDNPADLADKLQKVLSDENVAKSLAENAHKKYLLNHSWPQYAKNIRTMIEFFSSPEITNPEF